MVVTTSCQLSHTRAFDQATYKKYSKYQPAIDNSTITMIIPFIMLPFSVLTKPTKAFIKRAMGFVDPSKVAKACLHLSIAAAQGTARLAHTWNTCAVLIISDF
jgi:hypothetical protein